MARGPPKRLAKSGSLLHQRYVATLDFSLIQIVRTNLRAYDFKSGNNSSMRFCGTLFFIITLPPLIVCGETSFTTLPGTICLAWVTVPIAAFPELEIVFPTPLLTINCCLFCDIGFVPLVCEVAATSCVAVWLAVCPRLAAMAVTALPACPAALDMLKLTFGKVCTATPPLLVFTN
ncbi:hypothetical protein GQX74_009697 [Glossina fuscipes]|nr:hypothetical protein GQX74_009697 [Glossina fuscipes]